MSMTRKRVVLIQLMIIGAIGGWLAGACVNSSEGVLLGLMHINSFKGMLVGLLACAILMFPWEYSLHRKTWWASGIFFGVLASLFAVLGFFLMWPYEAHGRTDVHKTVLAILASYPYQIFGIGALLGLGGSSWVRPTQIHERMWIDIILPLLIAVGLLTILISMQPKIEESTENTEDLYALECCSKAYQAFVKKVGVSYAIFEAEKYCEVKCTSVVSCLDQCGVLRKNCATVDRACKDAYRACVLACPPPPKLD
jgi:hypothetical protein